MRDLKNIDWGKYDMKDTRDWIKFTISLCIAILFYVMLNNLNEISKCIESVGIILRPIIIGIAISFIVNPLVNYTEKHWFKGIKSKALAHHMSITVSFLIFGIIVILPVMILLPHILLYITSLFDNIDTYKNNAVTMLDSLSNNKIAVMLELNKESVLELIDNAINEFSNWIKSNYAHILETSVNVGKYATNIGIGFVLCIYFTSDKERILGWIKTLLKITMSENNYKSFITFWGRCNSILSKYIILDIVDAIIVGTINMLFMCIYGIPDAAIISICAAVTNLAPTFGPIVGAIIGGILLIFSSPGDIVIWLIFTLILQTVDGYIIKPKLFGGELGIPPILLLISIIILGRIFGILGVILSVPIAAIINFSYNEILIEKLKNMKSKQTKET